MLAISAEQKLKGPQSYVSILLFRLDSDCVFHGSIPFICVQFILFITTHY